jgi:hypothetical protein
MILSPSFGQAQVLSAFSPGGALSCTGLLPGFAATNTWTTANTAIYHPIRVTHPVVATKLHWLSGDVVNGNYDIGLYDATGRKLASSGSTAVPGTSTTVLYDMADLYLEQTIVYVALALSSATCRYYGFKLASDIQEMRLSGLVEQASALPLPATATFATLSAAVPVVQLAIFANPLS